MVRLDLGFSLNPEGINHMMTCGNWFGKLNKIYRFVF